MAVNTMQSSAITVTLSFINTTAAHHKEDCQYKYALSLFSFASYGALVIIIPNTVKFKLRFFECVCAKWMDEVGDAAGWEIHCESVLELV